MSTRLRRRSWSIVGLASVLALAVVAAATAGNSTSSAASGTVTLSGWASSPTETALLQQVLRGFEKTYPNIKVDYQPITGDYVPTMLAKFAARKPPDVFYIDSNVFLDWVTQGLLEPLDSYADKSNFSSKPFYPSLLSGFSHKGKIYGYPKDWSPLAMEVNTASRPRRTSPREDQDLERPLTAAAEAEGGHAERRQADLPEPELGPRARVRLPERGLLPERGEDAVDDQLARRERGDELLRRADQPGARRHPDQARRRLVRRGARQAEGRDHLRGQLAVPVHGVDVPDVHFSTQQHDADKQHGNLGFTVSYSMAKDAQNKPAAWQLLRYLVSQPGMKTWTSKGLALPSRKDVKPVAGRAAVPDRRACRPPVAVRAALQSGDRHGEQRALGGDRGQADGLRRCSRRSRHGEQHAQEAARCSPRAQPAREELRPRRSGGTQRRGATHDEAERASAASATAEALVGYLFIAVPMLSTRLLFFYPIGYAIYISRYDWGALGADRPRRLGRTTASSSTTSASGSRSRTASSSRSSSHDLHDGARPVRRRRRQQRAARTQLLPLRVLLPGDRLVGRDHGDRALHPLGRRALQHRSPGSDRAWFGDSGTALWTIVGLNSWTTSGTVMLFYLAVPAVDPDRRLRGGRDRRRRRLADVLEGDVPAAQAGPLLRLAAARDRRAEDVRPGVHRLGRNRRAEQRDARPASSTCTASPSTTSASGSPPRSAWR